MKLLALFAAVLLTVNASTDQEKWEAFKKTHGRTYKSLLEEKTRFGFFQSNLRKIEEHNAKYEKGETTFFMGVTRFTDWSHEEFRGMLQRQLLRKPALNGTLAVFPENLEVPETLDWTKAGAVTPIKDQLMCGDCWAFSAVGAMEGQNAIVRNIHSPLSEQQLLDCSGPYGNGDCEQGGAMELAYKYAIDHGLETQRNYPYSGVQGTCQAGGKKGFSMKSYVQITPTEGELLKALVSVGPISATIYSEPMQNFAGGILDESVCSDHDNPDHGVVVVGYGVANGVKFWRVKNSWGTDWGEEGFFRVKRDAGDLCGIALGTSYPVI